MSKFKSIENIRYDDDFIWYKTTCSCGSYDISFQFVHLGKGFKEYSLSFGVASKYPTWTCKWYKDWWLRIITAIKILAGNNIEFEEEFIFKDKKHVREFIDAIEEGLAKINKKIIMPPKKE